MSIETRLTKLEGQVIPLKRPLAIIRFREGETTAQAVMRYRSAGERVAAHFVALPEGMPTAAEWLTRYAPKS